MFFKALSAFLLTCGALYLGLTAVMAVWLFVAMVKGICQWIITRSN